MIRAISIAFICLLSVTGLQAQQLNKMVFDEKSQLDIILGPCSREGLINSPFAPDYHAEYSAYTLPFQILDSLKIVAEGLSMKLVLGTWCGDSKEQVPRFFKIYDMAKLDFPVELICVDRQKLAGETDISQLGIEKVPTFIFFRNGAEIGRIIETPLHSLEQDMLTIFKHP